MFPSSRVTERHLAVSPELAPPRPTQTTRRVDETLQYSVTIISHTQPNRNRYSVWSSVRYYSIVSGTSQQCVRERGRKREGERRKLFTSSLPTRQGNRNMCHLGYHTHIRHGKRHEETGRITRLGGIEGIGESRERTVEKQRKGMAHSNTQ